MGRLQRPVIVQHVGLEAKDIRQIVTRTGQGQERKIGQEIDQGRYHTECNQADGNPSQEKSGRPVRRGKIP